MEFVITIVQNDNRDYFAPLLPQEETQSNSVLLGAVAQGHACGVLQLQMIKQECQIKWLFVATEYRRMGCGTALLHAACELFARTGLEEMTAVYPQQAQNARVLDLFLLLCGFFIAPIASVRYRVPMEQLTQNAELIADLAKRLDAGHGEVLSINKLPHGTAEVFCATAATVGQILASEADFLSADSYLSMALMAEGQIKALLLAEQRGCELHLTLLYSTKQYSKSLPILILCFIHACRKREIRTKEFVFSCVNSSSQQLAKHFFKVEPETVYYQTAVLTAERMGAGADGRT